MRRWLLMGCRYVNDKGDIITVSTSRVVETSKKDNDKLMTIRRGMVNIDSDWKDAEAKRLALLRKAQLRETKRVQREEQKECAELIDKLRVEREKYVAFFFVCVLASFSHVLVTHC